MLVERAAAEETRAVVDRTREVSRMQPPSIMMASDVRRIVAQEQARMVNPQPPQQQNIVVQQPGNYADRPRVQVNPAHHSIAIRNENQGKNLRPVNK